MTDQDTNRENLSKLLSFLKERIFSRTENRWFSEALLAELSPSCSDKISDIYEQCIESILTEQANEFYKDFVIEELRPQLIRDFIKMEHWRRRNDIGEFGLHVFQQVECIMNQLCRDRVFDEVCFSMMNVKCYVEVKKNEPISVAKRKSDSTYLIGQLLFMEDAPKKSLMHLTDKEFSLLDKFRCINYFVCHRACLLNSQYNQYVEANSIFSKLKALRNTTHRNGNYDMTKISEIYQNSSRMFLVFATFLNWFIDSINAGWTLSQELISFARSNPYSSFVPNSGPTVVGKIDLKEDGRKRFK